MALSSACLASFPGQFNASGFLIAKNPVARCGPLGNAAPFPELRITATVHRDARVVVRVGCQLDCLASTLPALTLQSCNGAIFARLTGTLKLAQGDYINIRVEPKSHLTTASCFDQPGDCYLPTAITRLEVDGRNILFGGTSGVGAVAPRTNTAQMVQTCYQLRTTVLDGPTPAVERTGDVSDPSVPTGMCVVNSGDTGREVATDTRLLEDGEAELSGIANFTVPATPEAPAQNLGAMPIGAEIFSIVPATQLGVATFTDTDYVLGDTVAASGRTASLACST